MLARLVLRDTLVMKGAPISMSLSPQRVTFIVPEMPPSTGQPPKPAREASPFAVVPKPLAADERDALEPHWHLMIDAATD